MTVLTTDRVDAVRTTLYDHDTLRPLVSPQSVAVVGASLNAGFGRTVLTSLAASPSLTGRLWAVNPRFEELDGLPCVSSLRDIDQPLDLVVVGVRGANVPGVLEECVDAGVRTVLVHSSGFGETGSNDGNDLQRQISRIVDDSDLRLCGPNSLGMWNFVRDLSIGAHVTGAGQGPIGIVSQSGSLGMYTGQVAEQYGVPTSHLLFPGNSSDVDALDFANYLIDDPDTRVVVMVLEAMPNRRRVEELGRRSAVAGKPIVVYKLGRSSRGAAAAMSHTGSLVGSHDAAIAVMRHCGLTVVNEFEDLLETAKFFDTARTPKSKRLGVISAMGGVVVMACDAAQETGVELPTLSDHTLAELHAIVPDFGVVGNPVDVTATGGVLERTTAALQAVAADPSIDTVMVPLAPAAGLPERPSQLAELARTLDVNVVIYWMTQWYEGPGSEVLDREPGVGVFRSLRRAFAALKGWDDWNVWRSRNAQAGPLTQPVWTADLAATLSKQANLDAGCLTLDEHTSMVACVLAGIPFPPTRLVQSESEAIAAASEFGVAVALKIVSPDLAHKSDVGGVELGVQLGDVGSAYERLLAAVGEAAPAARVEGVLVVPMIEATHEFLVGGHVDPVAGPVVVCGWGGTSVGTIVPPVLEAAPLDRDGAARLLDRLAGVELLGEYRGSPPRDRAALESIIVSVSEMIAADVGISEIDLNPVFVLEDGHGAIAGDALVVLAVGNE